MTKIFGGILIIAAAAIFANSLIGLASVSLSVLVRIVIELFKIIGGVLIAVLGIALMEA